MSPSAISNYIAVLVPTALVDGGLDGRTYRVGCVVWSHSRAVKEEADCGHLLALSVAKGIHKLLQLCRALNLEEHFTAVIRDLDIQMVGRSRSPFLGRWSRLLIRHGEGKISLSLLWLPCESVRLKGDCRSHRKAETERMRIRVILTGQWCSGS